MIYMRHMEKKMPKSKKETSAAPKKSSKKTAKAAPVEVKVETLVVQETVAAPPPPPVPQLTEAQKIWEEIRHVQLGMFALPDQTVEMYCKNYPIEPTKCYMTVKVSAVMAALEDNLGKKFEFMPAGKFVVVTRK